MSEPKFIDNLPFQKAYSESMLHLSHGKGSYLYDTEGKEYLDFTSGIAVNALGHGNPKMVEIIAEQSEKLIHSSNLFATTPVVELGNKLLKTGDFEAVFFGNSGTEANEAALKYARLYAKEKKGEKHHKILAFKGGFHGRTVGALSVTHTEKYRTPFSPLMEGVHFVDYNDLEAIETTLDETFCAIIIEPIQGEGGLTVLNPIVAQRLNELKEKFDTLLIVDEIQTGLGRTGSLYASSEIGLKPDIITLAKPLGGGLPLSATLIPKKVNDLLIVGHHGTTFGGNPVVAALGNFIFDTVTNPSFLNEVTEKSIYLKELLETLILKTGIKGSFVGKGLLCGLKLEEYSSVEVSALLTKLMREGVLALRAGENVLRLAPPLTISKEEIQKGVSIIGECLT